jgi:hypothetical protein
VTAPQERKRYFGMKVIVRRREFRKTCFAEKYRNETELRVGLKVQLSKY